MRQDGDELDEASEEKEDTEACALVARSAKVDAMRDMSG